MKKIWRLSPLFLVSVALMFALACSSDEEAASTSDASAAAPVAPAAAPVAEATKGPGASKQEKGTIVFAQSTLQCPHGINTVYCGAYDSVAWGIGEDLFTWRWKDGGGIDYEAGQIAESYSLSDDLSTLSVKIRSGVKFHKGFGDMTADDVVHSYNKTNPMITPHSIAPSAANFASLFGKNPAVANGQNVDFQFENFDVAWVNNLMNTGGFVGVVIHSKKAFDQNDEAWAKENVVATGPYEVESWIRDDTAVFNAWDGHWEFPNPQARKVIVKAVPQNEVRIAGLQTGEIDATELALKSVPELQASGFATTSAGNANQFSFYFSGNMWESVHAGTGAKLDIAGSGVYAREIPWIGNPFSPDDSNNPEGMDDMEQARLVRWAVASSLDRDTINSELLGGLGTPNYVAFIDPKNEYHKEEWKIAYDPGGSVASLEKAGYSKKGNYFFELPIFVPSGSNGGLGEEIADAVGGYMEAIGLKTPVLKYPYAVHRPGLVGRTSTIPILYSDDDGQSVYPHDKPKGLVNSSLTRGGYCVCFETPTIAELYKKAAKEPSKAKRLEYADQFIDHVHYWALQPGVVALPQLTTYNPNVISEWVMQPTPFGTSTFANIKLK